jgi:uncharacterized coiled-coil protein SlyX
MTSEDLKNLVKEYFNLVEADATNETFGELKDENGAFTLKFPGDSLQVGDKVTVVTTEGQEMDAPDGEHRLEDGTMIRTKDSVVEEIMSADGEKEMAKEEMMEEEAVADVVEETVADVVEEAVADVVEEAVAEAVDAEEIVKALAEAMQEEMAKMKTKMAELEEKVKEMENVPAAEPTVTTGMNKSKFAVEKPQGFTTSNMDIMLEMIKNKKK